MSEYGIRKTTVLKTGHNSESSAHAQELLDRLVKYTAPLIERHRWRIEELKEFNPKRQGVLGMNARRGSNTVILIRLQRAGHKNASEKDIKAKNGNSKHKNMSSCNIAGFYTWDELLGTMIHELSHMVHSNHSAEFYSFMNDLYTEVEKDEASGTINSHKSIANTKGIDLNGKGRVLGGHNADIAKVAVFGGKINGATGTVGNNTQELRRLRAAAAEQRRNRNAMTGISSGNKVGKSLIERRFGSEIATMTPAQLSKWAAIQRTKDNESCLVGSQEDGRGEDGEKEASPFFWDNDNSTSSTDPRPTRHDNRHPSAVSKDTKNGSISSVRDKSGKSGADDGQVIELSPTTTTTTTASKTIKKSSSIQDAKEKSRRKRTRESSQENISGVPVVDLTLSGDEKEPKMKMKSHSNSSSSNNNSSSSASSVPLMLSIGYWECHSCAYCNATSVGIPTSSLQCEMCYYCPSNIEIEAMMVMAGGPNTASEAAAEAESEGFDPFKTVVSGGHNHWKK